MRIVIYYVLPSVALLLVLLLLYSRSKQTSVAGEDKPLVSAPIMIFVLGIGGVIGIFAVVYALNALGYI